MEQNLKMFLLKVKNHFWGTYSKLKLKTAAKNKQKIPNLDIYT